MGKQSFDNGKTDKKWWAKIHFDAFDILCIVIMIVCGVIWIPTYVRFMSGEDPSAQGWQWWVLFIGASIFILAFIYLLLDIGSQIIHRVREHKNCAGAANNEAHDEENNEADGEEVDKRENGMNDKDKSEPESLINFLKGDTEQKALLLERIKLRVSSQHKGEDLAILYTALQEEGLLEECDITKFHGALTKEFSAKIIKTERNLQKYVKKLNDATVKWKVKDQGEVRPKINAYREYLTEKRTSNK